MTVSFVEIEEWEKEIFQKQFRDYTLQFSHDHLSESNVEEFEKTEILSVFINSQLTKELLEKLPSLKLITTRSVGYDHIDMEYCTKKGIIVCNVPNYGVNTVAEHAIALLLALSRKIIPSVERTRKGDFSLEGLTGFDLYGKTLGVIGLGNIGTTVIKIAKGFGMKIVVTTGHPSEALAHKLGVTFLDLKELLSASDVVTIHVPHTKKTHHLLNKKNILKMKKGSILLNTARGPIVETEAILLALEKGILSGVGLDVLEEECSIKEERELMSHHFLAKCDLKTQLMNHMLLNKENVIVTPHNAFNSTEALNKIIQITTENITLFLEKRPQNLVVSSK